jgi:hypothetical protein
MGLSQERKEGMIDGLEISLDACDHVDVLEEAKKLIRYYLRLIKEEKYEKLREQLGALR